MRIKHAAILTCMFVFICTNSGQDLECASDEYCKAPRFGWEDGDYDPHEQPSVCLPSGKCRNPYHDGGCLYQKLKGERQREWKRVCHSEDDTSTTGDAASQFCRAPPMAEYTEIRIGSGNWESTVFGAWILQILFTEFLEVPASIETGQANHNLDFYSSELRYDLPRNVTYARDGLKNALTVPGGDCRHIVHTTKEDAEHYTMCAHVLPEVWSGQTENMAKLYQDGVIEIPRANGILAQSGWYILRFTAQQYPELTSYFGYSSREKLANIFLRPTTWQHYCQEVSQDNCTTANNVTQRAPNSPEEQGRYYVEGFYTGWFRKTEKSDCSNGKNCTGEFLDYDCGWSSFFVQQSFHLGIPLETTGSANEVGNGYKYSDTIDIIHAARTTRNHIILSWYAPEALFQEFLGTDAEFQRVALPVPSQTCIDARINPSERCNPDLTLAERVGHPDGACDESYEPLNIVLSSQVYEFSSNPNIPQAVQSPAHDALTAYQLSELQLGRIMDLLARRRATTPEHSNLDPREAVCQWVVDNMDVLHGLVPQGYPRVVVRVDNASPAFYAAVVLCSVAVLVVVLTTGLVLSLKKKNTNIAAAQIEFLVLLLAGLFLIATSGLTQAMEPSTVSCTLSIWFRDFGYSLELVPLVVKIAAVNRLAAAAMQMRRVTLDRKSLFYTVFGLSLVVLVYLAVWTTLDQPGVQSEFELTGSKTPVNETIVQESYYCDSNSDTWQYLSLGFRGVCLIIASALAFQTRNLPGTINESKSLGVMIYTQFFFLLLNIVILNLESAIAVSDLAKWFGLLHGCEVIAATGIYFGPKIFGEEESRLRVSFSNTRPNRSSRLSNSSFRNSSRHIKGPSDENGISDNDTEQPTSRPETEPAPPEARRRPAGSSSSVKSFG